MQVCDATSWCSKLRIALAEIRRKAADKNAPSRYDEDAMCPLLAVTRSTGLAILSEILCS
jgi:hypothetical protein